jgi:regulator of RNase E activity RraA
MAPPTDVLCDRYAALYTGAVTDALDALGYGSRALPSAITPLDRSLSVAGLAYPIHGYPDEDCDYDDNMRRFLRMLGDAPADSVVAYETRDDEAAHVGELSTTALEAGGCRGVVIDGGARDTHHILDQEFPVFTRYVTPADAPPRWRLAEWGVPVIIGDVEVRPGDVLLGDADGVVCVPKDVRVEVLEHAEDTVDTEDDVRAAIRDGADPLEAYDEYGEF